MTAIYTNNSNNFVIYNLANLNKEQCEPLIKKCNEDERTERLKAVAWGAGTVLAASVALVLSLKVAQFTVILFALILLPLAAIPPLYGTLIISIGLAAGAAFGYFSMKLILDHIFSHAKNHWDHAGHISNQGHRLQLHHVSLMGTNNEQQ